MCPNQHRIIIPILFTILVVVTGCRKTPPSHIVPTSPAVDAIATIGGQPIFQSDLDHFHKINPSKSPAALLEEVAREESLAQLAHAEGLTSDPSVRSAIRNMLASRIREKYITRSEPSEKEISEALAKQQEMAAPPKIELRLAVLRILFENAGSEELAVKRLKDVAGQSISDDSLGFGPLAVTYSDDTDTRYQGGDYGWIGEGQNHPLLPTVVNQSVSVLKKKRQLSEIVVANGAAWIVMIWDRRTATTKNSISRLQVADLLRHESERKKAEELIQFSLKKFPIVIMKPQNEEQTGAQSDDAPHSSAVPNLQR